MKYEKLTMFELNKSQKFHSRIGRTLFSSKHRKRQKNEDQRKPSKNWKSQAKQEKSKNQRPKAQILNFKVLKLLTKVKYEWTFWKQGLPAHRPPYLVPPWHRSGFDPMSTGLLLMARIDRHLFDVLAKTSHSLHQQKVPNPQYLARICSSLLFHVEL